jgi:hypothetical protein
MSKDTQVRVSAVTREAISKIAATVQLEAGTNITADIAIKRAIEDAFPDIAKALGIDTDKEIRERKKQ